MFFDEFSLGMLAIIAGAILLSGWIPQIIKGYRTKMLNDVSRYLMILVASGSVLWILYGYEKNDPYIIGVNIAAIALTMTVLSMKFIYEKQHT